MPDEQDDDRDQSKRPPESVWLVSAAQLPSASGPGDPINLGGLVDLPPGPWRELVSGVTLPGGPTAPADLLAREPQALLVRA